MIGRLKTPKRFFRRPKPTTSRKKLMSPKQILIVAVRLIVLIGIVQTLSSIVTIFAQSGSEYNSAQLLLPLSIYGFYLAVWLLLWCFPATIANRLLPEHLQTVQEAPKHPAPWLTTGIVLIGIYTVFQAIPDLIYQFSLSIFLYSLLLSTHIHPFGRTSAHKTKPAYLPTSRSFLSAFSCYSVHPNSHLGCKKDFNYIKTKGRLKPSDGLPYIHSHAQALT